MSITEEGRPPDDHTDLESNPSLPPPSSSDSTPPPSLLERAHPTQPAPPPQPAHFTHPPQLPQPAKSTHSEHSTAPLQSTQSAHAFKVSWLNSSTDPTVDVEKGQQPRPRFCNTPRCRSKTLTFLLLLSALTTAYWFIGDHLPGRATSISGEDRIDELPDDPKRLWGIYAPTSQHLLKGLRAWPENPPTGPPLSDLGPLADSVYNQGQHTLAEYLATLSEFIELYFPTDVQYHLQAGLGTYLGLPSGDDDVEDQPHLYRPSTPPFDTEKNIWQTDKVGESRGRATVKTWSSGDVVSQGWTWQLLPDAEASQYVQSKFRSDNSRVLELWEAMPNGILRSDMLRYLLLLDKGGIYSDTDTNLLRTPDRWGSGPDLWKGGEGWLNATTLGRLEGGEQVDAVLGRPSVVLGIEADIPPDREDWNDWWPRPLQIVQWTMASAPSHPIALSALLRIVHATARAADWSRDRWDRVRSLRAKGEWEAAEAALSALIDYNPAQGGPVGVMDWSGPGVWTDAALTYLRIRYGVRWIDLRSLRRPVRIGEVVVLPVTGFSPGVGQFGAGTTDSDQAMVEHEFRGSWKQGIYRRLFR